MPHHYEEWQPIRMFAEGLQPHTARHWNCEPAWNVAAVYAQADGAIAHPTDKSRSMPVFWDRHLDNRFHIEYRNARKDVPRVQGRTIGDADREWDTLIEYRDRYLREAGLTLQSPAAKIARVMAETNRFEAHSLRPQAATFPGSERQHLHVIEGVLHTSWCVGCTRGFMGLADACGLTVRGIGMPGHHVAEVLVDGKWRLADPAGRHHAGDPVYFEGSYHDTMLDPAGDYGTPMSDKWREGFWNRPYGVFDFHGGQWDIPCEMRFAARSARALYPDNAKWGFKSPDGRRLPISVGTCGFIWPGVNSGADEEAFALLRRTAFPEPMPGTKISADFFYHAFQPGQRLRSSFYLGDRDMQEIELTFSFAPSRMSDFGDAAGDQVMVKVGDFVSSLRKLGAWPPKAATEEDPGLPGAARGLLHSTVRLKRDAFRGDAVNWFELRHEGRGLYYMPCITSAMEPYIAPLWAETEDAFRPAVAR